MKTCTRCGKNKPDTAYGFKTPGKREARCKPCRSAASKEWADRNKDKVSAANRAYRTKHAEQIHKSQREWRAANKEYIARKNREWYENNKVRHRENGKRWALRNPDKMKAMYRAAHKGRKMGPKALGYASIIVNDPCAYCGKKGGTVDHIDPIARGGSNEWNNLAGACRKCNASKCASPLIEFLARKSDCSIIQL